MQTGGESGEHDGSALDRFLDAAGFGLLARLSDNLQLLQSFGLVVGGELGLIDRGLQCLEQSLDAGLVRLRIG